MGAFAALLLVWSVALSGHLRPGQCNALDLGCALCAAVSFVLFELRMYAWRRANRMVPFPWRMNR